MTHPNITNPILRQVLADKLRSLYKSEKAFSNLNEAGRERIKHQRETAVHYVTETIESVQFAMDWAE